MAKMVKYNDEYVDMAYKLVKQKSNADDVKAATDLYVTNAVLSGENICVKSDALDERLRKEYKTIEMMEAVASKFTFNDGRANNRIISQDEVMMNRLESDRMGIIADVLIKHEIIKYVDELYVRLRV